MSVTTHQDEDHADGGQEVGGREETREERADRQWGS